MLFQTGDHREVLNFFFFNDTATTEIYTLSLHDALPILLIVKKSALRRSLLPPKARKGKPRTVVDTNVLVAGIAGFRKPLFYCRNPKADVLHRGAGQKNFFWFLKEEIFGSEERP